MKNKHREKEEEKSEHIWVVEEVNDPLDHVWKVLENIHTQH